MQKFIFDLLPALVLFVTFYIYDIYAATAAAIICSGCQIVWLILRGKKVEKMYYFIFCSLFILGGATLYLQNANFIKVKPTVVNWALAAAFLISEFIGKSSLIRKLLGTALNLTDQQWRQVNFNFVGLFIFCGALNLLVAFTCSEEFWVNFRLWGLSAINMIFMGTQLFLLRNHLVPLPEEDETKSESGA